jgi:ribose 1,5-bisphosphokinase PhnN
MGPSGAGKDSLMAYARARVSEDAPILFAHRYITRPERMELESNIDHPGLLVITNVGPLATAGDRFLKTIVGENTSRF